MNGDGMKPSSSFYRPPIAGDSQASGNPPPKPFLLFFFRITPFINSERGYYEGDACRRARPSFHPRSRLRTRAQERKRIHGCSTPFLHRPPRRWSRRQSSTPRPHLRVSTSASMCCAQEHHIDVMSTLVRDAASDFRHGTVSRDIQRR
jgi:hypothetical protein